MTEVDYRALRRRRRIYAVRAGIGFEGFIVGSWQHAFQALLRPFGIPVVVAAIVATVGFASIAGAIILRGGLPSNAAAFSAALVSGLWLIGSVVSFAWGMRRARAMPPGSPGNGPRASGVREPRRRPPDPGVLAVEIDGTQHAAD
ncbi:MAG: hypothetical protein QNJ81_02915 [Acidimicrobiia bacterium]|nr:hypothetical protein [Acidimicrobiia bacterium]